MEKIDKLKKIKELLDSGTISQTEFEVLKEKVINEKEDYSSKKYETELQNQNTSFNKRKNKQKTNIDAVVWSCISIICVFFPWINSYGETTFCGFSINWPNGDVSGIFIFYGLLCLIMSIIGGVLTFIGKKWVGVFGLINCIVGIGYIAGWFDFSEYIELNSTSVFFLSGYAPKNGLLIFIICSFQFAISSFWGYPD